jgi:hypothetical protein
MIKKLALLVAALTLAMPVFAQTSTPAAGATTAAPAADAAKPAKAKKAHKAHKAKAAKKDDSSAAK